MRREVKVGIFMAGVLAILAVLIFIVGNVSNLLRGPGYPLYVHFDTALGVDKSAAVRMAGIKIGYVQDITLDVRAAKVTLKIFRRYLVPEGSAAGQAVQGLLGEKYVEIRPSDRRTFYRPGAELPPLPPGGLDQLAPMLTGVAEDVKGLSESLRGLVSAGLKKDLDASLSHLASVSGSLDTLLAENKDRIGRSLESADRTFSGLDAQVQSLGDAVRGAADSLSGVVSENRAGIGESVGRMKGILDRLERSVALLETTLRKIDQGQGTLGKLVNDPEVFDEARSAVKGAQAALGAVSRVKVGAGVRSDYLNTTGKLRSAFSLSVGSGPKFLQAGLVEDPLGDRILYSAEAGLRVGPVAPRAGILESSFGGGVDVYVLGDRVVLSLEALRFNRVRSPLFRAVARVYPVRNVFVALGLEDFSLADRRQVYFGLGFGTR